MPGVKDWLKKALKAFMILTQKSIPKTHDLGFLLGNCIEINDEFMLLQEESKNLNSYGCDARYPNDFFYVDKQSTEEAIEMAEKILITVKNKMNIVSNLK
jgi:HEPN domain-containing protein